jgi:hypothetical protein
MIAHAKKKRITKTVKINNNKFNTKMKFRCQNKFFHPELEIIKGFIKIGTLMSVVFFF